MFWPPFWTGIVLFLSVFFFFFFSFSFLMLFQQCKSIHALLLWAKFNWKLLFGKVVFQTWSRDCFRKMEIIILAAILKWRMPQFDSLMVRIWKPLLKSELKKNTAYPDSALLQIMGFSWSLTTPTCLAVVLSIWGGGGVGSFVVSFFIRN